MCASSPWCRHFLCFDCVSCYEGAQFIGLVTACPPPPRPSAPLMCCILFALPSLLRLLKVLCRVLNPNLNPTEMPQRRFTVHTDTLPFSEPSRSLVSATFISLFVSLCFPGSSASPPLIPALRYHPTHNLPFQCPPPPIYAAGASAGAGAGSSASAGGEGKVRDRRREIAREGGSAWVREGG